MEPKHMILVPTSVATLTMSFFLFFLFPLTLSQQPHTNNQPPHYELIELTSAVGPESLAFDCFGGGPYTGVADGRILKWEGPARGWTEFAVTSRYRVRDVCLGDPLLEFVCGRPLGLKFNNVTCDLYIADAYFGLSVVGPGGGLAQQLVTSAQFMPFRFTNDLDIDQNTGIVYFTDSSARFQRWEYICSILNVDKTGRLMKYDPRTGEVTVLLQGLAFANGVAVSKDGSFVLVAETTTGNIQRFWAQGPKASTSDLFIRLQGQPDNIERNARGEFWVALNPARQCNLPNPWWCWRQNSTCTQQPTSIVHSKALKLSEEGMVLEEFGGVGRDTLVSISEVQENDGALWIGSLVMPLISIYKR